MCVLSVSTFLNSSRECDSSNCVIANVYTLCYVTNDNIDKHVRSQSERGLLCITAIRGIHLGQDPLTRGVRPWVDALISARTVSQFRLGGLL